MEIGDQVQLAARPERPRLVKITHIQRDQWNGPPSKVWVKAVLHETEEGTVYKPGETWSLDIDRFEALREDAEPIAPHIVSVARCVDTLKDGTEKIKHKRKVSGVVHLTANGGAACATTLRCDKKLPVRFCQFRNKWLPAREQTSVWLATYMPVTCLKCRQLPLFGSEG